MTARLQRISPLLQVRDLNTSIAFYTGKLGFEEKWREENGFAILSRDDCDLFLGQKERQADLRNVITKNQEDLYAAYDLYIHCAPGAATELWQEFHRRDVDIREKAGPVQQEYGVEDFTVIDPDGYAIVFGSPLTT